ncbi:YdiU family protein [Glaciecola sp. MH2013]|uniref:protein adenylyltransferase SelO n=1 Tax=Glaciecola sp. MH2013 TaxID=2785524 RepID=UPI00189C87E7|nr:YdiU family protein [Glaciecola sp. MH2013]MBF7073625.1 YdiU family protein [Glaciecola sp. MH2013]
MQLFHHYATELSDICSPVQPFPLSRPRVAMLNDDLINELGLQRNEFENDKILQSLFSDKGELQDKSIAQKYGGHQFGQWNPNLGDGRGLLLGEIKNSDGQLIDLHLKGAGPTPYSRHADGRAVLRSTIREYLAGEALHALGIPSSRSLCLISSHEPVVREQRERGAMMIRTCPSHIRFGHFEYYYHSKQTSQLDALFAFCFTHHFQDCASSHAAMLLKIVRSTALMIAKWQAYGFNHGVMNTDNMSIHGITFDYGPYAFLDDFIPNYVCNRSDHSGRYAFDQQPSIGLWNLNALAHAFTPFVEIEELKEILSTYEPCLVNEYQSLVRARLGLSISSLNANSNNGGDGDDTNDDKLANEIDNLVHEWLNILKDEKADYHIPFRLLSERLLLIKDRNYNALSDDFIDANRVRQWCVNYHEVINIVMKIDDLSWEQIQSRMLAVNPKYVLRNHLAQAAIAAAEEDDFSLCEALLEALKQPFSEQQGMAQFAKAPDTSSKGISLSCSS